MYPKNAASPEPIAIGAVVQISDGAVQTSGCTVRIKPIGVAEGDGAGTTAYSTDGIVYYTPTQGETNYTSFILIAKKTGCIPVAITVVTSASATAGYAGTDQSKIANPTSTVALTGTTIATTQKVDVETIKTQALTAAAGITFGVYVGGTAAAAIASTALSTAQWTNTLATNIGTTNTTVATNLDATISSRMATYTQPTGFLAASFPTDPADQSIIIAATDAILAAVGTRSTQTSVDDLPTNAELATALAAADDAMLAAIATVQSDTNDIQTRLPAALDGGRITAVLDSAVGTQINKIEAAVAGTVTGAGTATEIFVGPSATLTITVDSSGNRSAVVVT